MDQQFRQNRHIIDNPNLMHWKYNDALVTIS